MKKALLVIDVQMEYFTGKMKVTYPMESLPNIKRVMEFAKQKGMKIVVVQHTNLEKSTFVKGTEGWELHDAIKERAFDYLVEKTRPSSFCGTNLEEILKKDNIEGVVIVGYMTQMCCDSTAREAFHRGYHVDFLSDATGTIDVTTPIGSISSEELHKAALITQSMAFSNVVTTEEWMEKYLENNR